MLDMIIGLFSNPVTLLGGGAGIAALLFRSSLSGFVGRVGGGSSILLVVVGFVLCFLLQMLTGQTGYQKMARDNQKIATAFLNRDAIRENNCLARVQLHAWNAYSAMQKLDETSGLIVRVASATNDGRKQAEQRAAKIRSENKMLLDEYTKILLRLDNAKLKENGVEEYLSTPVPDAIRSIGGMRNDTTGKDDKDPHGASGK